MTLENRLRAILGVVPRISIRRHARRFFAATEDCAGTQRQVLQDLLALNDGSRFSREHGFGQVRTVEEFRRRMPIADFEYFRTYIEDLKQGEHSALLGSHNRLLMFTLSSGTTSKSKFIPITERFLADYRRNWQTWGIMAFDAHPKIYQSKIVQLTSDHDRFRTAGDTPCGNISGLVAAMQKSIVRKMYAVPSVVSKISNSEAKAYTALRLSLADRNVGLFTTANPSTLIQLAKQADAWREHLIRDISDGTLWSGVEVDDEVRQKLESLTNKRSNSRARELEQVIERCGSLLPKEAWPDAQLLAVWTGGSAGAYLHNLRKYFGDTPVRDHGLSASEGRMTIPIEDGRSSGILDVTTHFFEFIPENEHGKQDATVLEAHELQEGQNYYILLTTSSGLYRYDIRDVVRCTGFYGTTPMLEFLHKGAHISNITGEKVSESQIADAVSTSAAKLDIDLQHFMVTPVWGEPPEYQLLVENQDVMSTGLRDSLAQSVDSSLQELNCEYREKRGTGRLAPMQCIALTDGAWRSFIGSRISRLGGSLEQYKHPCLVPDLEFKSRVMNEFILEPAGKGDRDGSSGAIAAG